MPDGAVGVFLGVLAIAAALAAVVGYFLVKVRDARDDVLRKTNDDLLQRVDVLERDKATLEARVAAQQTQINALQDLASGTSAIKALEAHLLAFFEKHESEAHERYRMLIESQDHVAEAIGKFTVAVKEARGG